MHVDALTLAYPFTRARSLRVDDAQERFAGSLPEEALTRRRSGTTPLRTVDLTTSVAQSVETVNQATMLT